MSEPLYHFTDGQSAIKILKSGIIKQSTADGPNRDAVLGDGVYATAMDPNKHSKESIARNNWDDKTLPQQKIAEGKMDVAFKIKPQPGSVVKANSDRNLYLHHGDLSTRQVEDVLVRTKDGTYQSAKQMKP